MIDKKYEYLSLKPGVDFLDDLNYLGSNGWQLTQAFVNGEYILMREIVDEVESDNAKTNSGTNGVGKSGEELFDAIIKRVGASTNGKKSGLSHKGTFDTEATLGGYSSRKYEVKTANKDTSGGFQYDYIRPEGDYDYLVLIAIDGSNTKITVVPRTAFIKTEKDGVERWAIKCGGKTYFLTPMEKGVFNGGLKTSVRTKNMEYWRFVDIDKCDGMILDSLKGAVRNPKRKRGENFSFANVGIVVGDTIKFDKTGEEVKVVNTKNKVEYNGEEYSLSGLCRKLLGGKNYDGPLYFSYNGTPLKELK